MTLHVIHIEGLMCLATSNMMVLVNSTFGGDLDDDLYSAVHQLPLLARKHSGKIFFLYIIALDRIMAWRRPGNKPLSGPMMVSLLMHICVTRPQLIKLGFIILWCLAFCWLGAPFTYRKISWLTVCELNYLSIGQGLHFFFTQIFQLGPHFLKVLGSQYIWLMLNLIQHCFRILTFKTGPNFSKVVGS